MAKAPVSKPLTPIPYVDLREGSLVDLLETQKQNNVVKKMKKKLGFLGPLLAWLPLRIGDFFSKRWLKKSRNPYLGEIKTFAKALKTRGVYALNLSYEWACTTGVFPEGAGTKMMRVLDWPMPRMGDSLIVAHQKGAAGDFLNVTWLGLSGVFNAVAPGRFAAAINQAPMRRKRFGIAVDWLRNRRKVNKSRALPPAHLLRQVFETAADYQTAKDMLTTTPLAAPTLYILSGTKEGEGFVIERTETQAIVREMKDGTVCASNQFETAINGDGPEKGKRWMLRRKCSPARGAAARKLSSQDVDDTFTWFKAPIANSFSKLALVADAAAGTLTVIGTEGQKAVTQPFKYEPAK
jgi:hypothetical protein